MPGTPPAGCQDVFHNKRIPRMVLHAKFNTLCIFRSGFTSKQAVEPSYMTCFRGVKLPTFR